MISDQIISTFGAGGSDRGEWGLVLLILDWGGGVDDGTFPEKGWRHSFTPHLESHTWSALGPLGVLLRSLDANKRGRFCIVSSRSINRAHR